jgi:AmmeMemoRadiSam system protein A
MAPSPSSMPEGSDLSPSDGKLLIATAREAIACRLEARAPLWPQPAADRVPALGAKRGAFVTLRSGKKKGAPLRGCIGRMNANESLLKVVREMAAAAAFEDPRFPSLNTTEYSGISVEITVLTPMLPIRGVGEIEVGRHGVYLTKGWQQAVFLPQVATEQGWNREELLANLCRKAGLPPDAWREDDARFQVFEGLIFEEE